MPSPMTHAILPELGAAFCTTKKVKSEVTHRWYCRLDNNNFIFQAELFVIFKALDGISQQNQFFSIPSLNNSLSTVQTIRSFDSTNLQIIEIKSLLINLLLKTNLSHVSDHKGILGNKMVNILTNEVAARQSVVFSLLIPHLYIKVHHRAHLVKQRQDK